ncbi:two-component sensor histidine kinase, partial [Streptomyces sp. NPDC023588]
VTATPDGLDLTVINRTGTRTRTFPTSGHGLSGLAERVRLLHGQFHSAPDGPHHWRLAVQLPVRGGRM